jgi:hypothetical protein
MRALASIALAVAIAGWSTSAHADDHANEYGFDFGAGGIAMPDQDYLVIAGMGARFGERIRHRLAWRAELDVWMSLNDADDSNENEGLVVRLGTAIRYSVKRSAPTKKIGTDLFFDAGVGLGEAVSRYGDITSHPDIMLGVGAALDLRENYRSSRSKRWGGFVSARMMIPVANRAPGFFLSVGYIWGQ